MPNTNAPAGLQAIRRLNGGPVTLSAYRIASGYGTSIFDGDLVKSAGTGKTIAQSAATDVSVGVFHGCEYIDSQGNVIFSRYWPASTVPKAGTEVIAWVYDDPLILFKVQAAASVGVVATDIGQSADIVVGTGNTSTGQSAGVLNAPGTSKMLHLYELNEADDNAYGPNAKVNVLINKHELKPVLTDV